MRDVGLNPTIKVVAMPVPDNAMVCIGLGKALSLISTWANKDPVAEGANSTEIVHEAPGRMGPVRQLEVLEIMKSVGFPLGSSAMEDMVRFALPEFVTVTVCGGLVTP